MNANCHSGHLKKMIVELADKVHYQLPLDDQRIDLNPLVGEQLRLEYAGDIHCHHCGRKTKKSFNQGYCYPCFSRLAQCDSCIISPEKCHYEQGTCREPEWGEQFCMTDHIVYLANSSGIKVGITRINQIPTRWIDQGAVQALPILRVATRQQSGLVEDALRQHVADKTNWRAMLKNDVVEMDLAAKRDELFDLCNSELAQLTDRFGINAIQPVDDAEAINIDYPVIEYTTKVTSFNFDKTPVVEGRLMGIKGQYLMFDTGVINIRKFTAYNITVNF
ncbi:DUF2797 domain-containing protein [Porticoccus sp. W117]|uniref:DUF2797 domain-containing protein n=1 Tax=Porticoccus sp. W117 TaxID=3054777 RepID=UPI002595A477|nr:DUF2797 domain-containing protein [Porticoccus sp. W117]MDM3870316.1 DUF2797 domain-containing protein [Porticoccus sp. W117]